MAKRVKVPIPGSAGKFQFIDVDATAGAEVGVNLIYQGRVLRPDEVLNSAVQAGDTIFQGSFDGGGPGGDLTTDAVIEGSNLYFTAERAQDAAGAVLDGTGDVPLIYTTGPRKISAALSVTGVAAGSYGDATHVATFTVDAKGRLTAAGTASIVFPSVATDPIWDAKGDLAVGTGANTAARLPVGADGAVLVPDSTQTTGLRYSKIDFIDTALTANRIYSWPDYAGHAVVSDNVNDTFNGKFYSTNGLGTVNSSDTAKVSFSVDASSWALTYFDGSTSIASISGNVKNTTVVNQLALSGATTATLSGDVNNYAPSGLSAATRLELTASGADRTITGIDASLVIAGTILSIRNVGSSRLIVLKHASASSTATNRFSLPGAADVKLSPGAAFLAIYDATAARFMAFSQRNSSSIQIDLIPASATWTKPEGFNQHRVTAIGAGGGGGSGRKGTTLVGTVAICGGGAGSSGARSEMVYATDDLTATVAVTIGAGGTGGAAQATNSTNGNTGAPGGATTFGVYLKALGGLAGGGGTLTTGSGGGASNGLFSNGATGGSASTTGGSPSAGGTVNYASTGGAAGGGITILGVRSPGGTARGGTGINFANLSDVDLAPGSFTNADAGVATAGSAHAGTLLGSGGGGSPSSLLTNAKVGGAGGGYGAGGGGGGAALDSVGNSGAGGAGSDGYVRVISW